MKTAVLPFCRTSRRTPPRRFPLSSRRRENDRRTTDCARPRKARASRRAGACRRRARADSRSRPDKRAVQPATRHLPRCLARCRGFPASSRAIFVLQGTAFSLEHDATCRGRLKSRNGLWHAHATSPTSARSTPRVRLNLFDLPQAGLAEHVERSRRRDLERQPSTAIRSPRPLAGEPPAHVAKPDDRSVTFRPQSRAPETRGSASPELSIAVDGLLTISTNSNQLQFPAMAPAMSNIAAGAGAHSPPAGADQLRPTTTRGRITRHGPFQREDARALS